MATKLRAHVSTNAALAKGAAPTSEEIFVRNDSVSLCFLLNRRARAMRVIDFRAGASPAKKLFAQSIARRERIEKVIVLVERDECANWGRLGFAREGNIPGFYRRSDAFIMGYLVPPPNAPVVAAKPALGSARGSLSESGVFAVGRHGVFTVEEEIEEEPTPPVSNARAERTVTHARRIGKELSSSPALASKLAPATPAEMNKRLAQAAKEARALTGFEPFGRDVSRDDVIVTAKGHADVVIGAEVQRCYGNAFLEVLTTPRDDRELRLLASAIGATCDRLLAAEIVCAFALAPVDDVKMSAAYAANGFRRTGLLRQHLRLKRPSGSSERVDALLWSRKLATPQDE